MQFDGLVALHRIRELHTRTESVNRVLRGVAPAGHEPLPVMGMTAEVVEMARLVALTPHLHEPEEASLVVGVRDPDPRIRSLAVVGCGARRAFTESVACEWALISAAYDPADSVVRDAIASLPVDSVLSTGGRQVLERRFVALLNHEVDVRRAVADAAARTKTSTPVTRQLRAVLSSDKSWLVRRALSKPTA
jgi:hypothetical protein